MKASAKESRRMKRYAFMNFVVIAAIIVGSGIVIGELTQQVWPSCLFAAVLTTAGFIFVPIVNQRALDRLERISKDELQ